VPKLKYEWCYIKVKVIKLSVKLKCHTDF